MSLFQPLLSFKIFSGTSWLPGHGHPQLVAVEDLLQERLGDVSREEIVAHEMLDLCNRSFL